MTLPFRIAEFFVFTCAACLLASGCERKIEYVQATDESVAGDQDPAATTIELSAADVIVLTREAIDGDDSAAMTLYLYYDSVGDRSASLKWLELAASRGDCDSIIALIWELESEGSRNSIASKWREKRDTLKCRSTAKYRYREHQ